MAKEKVEVQPEIQTEQQMLDAKAQQDKAIEDKTKEVLKDTNLSETAAKEAATGVALVEQSGYSFGGYEVNAEVVTIPVYGALKPHLNDVKFDVKYPSGYKGDKNMPEGPVVVSKESAEHFKTLGIGKIVD